jgi:hypothetical protein
MRHFLHKISEALSSDGEVFDNIIHLGAGGDAERSDYESLRYRKLVLVEGDPEAAEVLGDSLGSDLDVQIVPSLVTPSGGDVKFYRYNLSGANGILPAGTLSSLYPRLRLLDEETHPSASLSDVIERLEIDAANKNLLILDLPGQEAELIESLTRDQLRKFQFIVIHGCLEAYQEGAKDLSATLSLLGRSHYKLVDQDAEEDLQWPIALFEFDGAIAEVVHQRDELQSAHAVLNEELENRARLLVEKATQIHQQGERILEAERHFGEVSTHREALQGEVITKADLLRQQGERIIELERVVGELTAHRDALTAERDGLYERIAGLESQVQDQLGRQKCIKDEMAKAEAQLEMLKELTRPALS